MVGLGVGDGRGTDGDDGGLTCGGVIGSVHIAVTGSDNGSNTRGDEFGGGVVDGRGEITTKAQGGNGRVTGLFNIISNPVNSGNAVWNSKVIPRNELIRWGRTYQNWYRFCGKEDSGRRNSRREIMYTPAITQDLDSNDLGRLCDTAVSRVRHLLQKHSL